MARFTFDIIHAPGDPRFARAGIITTPHGTIETPAFIPVGTRAAVKALTWDQLESVGAQAMLSNAYHLFLQPGYTLIEQAGGLAKFTGWDKPTFTDSGGFQVLSLGSGYKKIFFMDAAASSSTPVSSRHAFVDDDGVNFKSHIDGTLHRFTPEISMAIQHAVGADICFAFDELTSLADPYEYQVESLARTHRWAERSLKAFRALQAEHPDRPQQALFGVLQGAHFEDLRRQAARFISSLEFDGFGIGGAIEKTHLGATVKWTTEELPAAKPKHLLGISEPDDIFDAVAAGIDTFDCVSPTRVGRNGAAYSLDGRFNITAARYKSDFNPLDRECGCPSCSRYTRAYIHHLFRVKERTAGTIVSLHNEYFILKLVRDIRASIIDGSFTDLRDSWLGRYYPHRKP